MKVLQIANGYLGNRLYENLFSALKEWGVESIAYVPLNRKDTSAPSVGKDVVLSHCFTDLDRLLFFSKQKKLLQDIEARGLHRGVSMVHAHTVFSGGYTALQLHRRWGLPYITAVRNTDINVFFQRMPHLRRTGLMILDSAEKIIFLSSAYREQLFSKYVPDSSRPALEKKSLVIPNGIAPLFFQSSPPPKAPPGKVLRLIYVGELSTNKNLEATVQAAKILRREGFDVRLLAVGAILEGKYRALIKKTDFLEHHDRCPQTDVIGYLRNADIFVMPSHTETFGLVYAEAMSQGLPVVYTRGQGFDGQFPDGEVGWAVSGKDPAELADAIRRCLPRYKELSENCLKLVGKFDWNSIAKQYRSIYLECRKGLGG